MKMGISSAEVRLVKDFLLSRLPEATAKEYSDGYREAINDMTELLSEKVRQEMENIFTAAMSFDDLANDVIDNPSHYKGRHSMEAIDVVRNFATVEEERGFYFGNTLKYLLRHRGKNGLEDLKKGKKEP